MFNKQGPSTRDDVIVRKDIRGFLAPARHPALRRPPISQPEPLSRPRALPRSG